MRVAAGFMRLSATSTTSTLLIKSYSLANLERGLLISPQVERAEMRCVGQRRFWWVVVWRPRLGYSDSWDEYQGTNRRDLIHNWPGSGPCGS